MTTATLTERPLAERTRDVLKRAGNPFRNYFARNPDDEVCARYHVPELFAAERDLLHAIIDLYRYDPMTHSEVVPVLGNKGAGKTHLLHSIKHGVGGQWQLLVTPGVYQKDTDFLEYLLFQIIDGEAFIERIQVHVDIKIIAEIDVERLFQCLFNLKVELLCLGFGSHCLPTSYSLL